MIMPIYSIIDDEVKELEKKQRLAKVFGIIFLILGGLIITFGVILFLILAPLFGYPAFVFLSVPLSGLVINLIGAILFILRNYVYERRIIKRMVTKARYQYFEKRREARFGEVYNGLL